MAINYIQPTIEIYFPCPCVICQVTLLSTTATAGQFDADNQQKFACISHFSEPEKLISGWADFMWRERKRGNRSMNFTDFSTGRAFVRDDN